MKSDKVVKLNILNEYLRAFILMSYQNYMSVHKMSGQITSDNYKVSEVCCLVYELYNNTTDNILLCSVMCLHF